MFLLSCSKRRWPAYNTQTLAPSALVLHGLSDPAKSTRFSCEVCSTDPLLSWIRVVSLALAMTSWRVVHWCFITLSSLFSFLVWAHMLSMVSVWAPVTGSTKFCEWFTVLWSYPWLFKLAYALHSSLLYNCARFNKLLYDRHEGCSISFRHLNHERFCAAPLSAT